MKLYEGELAFIFSNHELKIKHEEFQTIWIFIRKEDFSVATKALTIWNQFFYFIQELGFSSLTDIKCKKKLKMAHEHIIGICKHLLIDWF